MKLLMRCLHVILVVVFAIVTFGCGQGGTLNAPPPVPPVAPQPPTSPDTAPVLISISSPTSATAGGAGFLMVVTGSGFKSNSIVLWNGSPRVTHSAGQDALEAEITAADIGQAGIAKISVNNPATGSGQALTSGALDFPIFSLRLASLSPSSVREGTAGASIDVRGAGFVQGSVVRWNGQVRPTTFASDSKLIVNLPASDLAFAGIAWVVVENPNTPYSNQQLFVVTGGGMTMERISLGDAGEQLAAPSFDPAVDYTGRSVAYVDGIVNTSNTVVARDTCLNAGSGCVPTNNVVSTDSSGDVIYFVQSINVPAVSSDGRWVAFSQDLPPGSEYLSAEVGVRDTCLGAVTCTPATSFPGRNSTGQTIAGVTAFPSFSADARYVAFTAGESDGLFFVTAQPVVYDSCRGAIGSCTPSHFSQEAFSETGQPVTLAYTSRQSLSADGRYLAFAGVIEPNDYPSGDYGVWVRDSCLGAGPSCVPSTVRASVNIDGQPLVGYYPTFAMSASGRYVAFAPNPGGLILLRDTCIGAPAGCIPATTRAGVYTNGFAFQPNVTAFSLSISAEGRRIAFAAALFDSYKQTYSVNVFVRDTCVGASGCDPKTLLVSVGSSGSFANGNSLAPMISGDGKYVVFQSEATDLVPGDTNGFTDIFRVALP